MSARYPGICIQYQYILHMQYTIIQYTVYTRMHWKKPVCLGFYQVNTGKYWPGQVSTHWYLTLVILILDIQYTFTCTLNYYLIPMSVLSLAKTNFIILIDFLLIFCKNTLDFNF